MGGLPNVNVMLHLFLGQFWTFYVNIWVENWHFETVKNLVFLACLVNNKLTNKKTIIWMCLCLSTAASAMKTVEGCAEYCAIWSKTGDVAKHHTFVWTMAHVRRLRWKSQNGWIRRKVASVRLIILLYVESALNPCLLSVSLAVMMISSG